jgi:hypothetical protein
MKHESSRPRVWKREASNLLLFPDESPTSPEVPPMTNAPPTVESFAPQTSCLTLAQIAAEWQVFLKRLGRRRRVLETILTAAHPVRLTGNTLIIGFPPHRRFHRELFDTPDYRACVEEELAWMFRVRLSVMTALSPDGRDLHRNGPTAEAPA